MKVGLVSLGCVKNQVDAEQMLSLLLGAGYEFTADAAEAEIILVNTCGFIQSAKEESIEAILDMARMKQEGRCKVLCVTGCLAQRYEKELLGEIPEIDCLLGVGGQDRLPGMIAEALQGERPHDVRRENGFLECGRVLTTPPYTAYVKIGDGCDNRCTFCAIPLIRGAYRSRPREAILAEMRTLAAQGAKEQILIAQDTTRYGIDTGDSLAALLRDAAKIDGIDWLRVLYMYPDEVTDELLDTMAALPNVAPYLDLPLQHASMRLLPRMNRRGNTETSRRLLKKARDMGFCLRTTFIVGFPGETDADFEELMDFTREMAFDRMGAFAYSAEEDTPAAAMPGQVPEEIKQERLDRLMALQAEISLARNRLRVGSTARVLVTGREQGGYIGRSVMEAPDADGVIRFASPRALAEGTFADVRLTDADEYDLYGEVTE